MTDPTILAGANYETCGRTERSMDESPCRNPAPAKGMACHRCREFIELCNAHGKWLESTNEKLNKETDNAS